MFETESCSKAVLKAHGHGEFAVFVVKAMLTYDKLPWKVHHMARGRITKISKLSSESFSEVFYSRLDGRNDDRILYQTCFFFQFRFTMNLAYA